MYCDRVPTQPTSSRTPLKMSAARTGCLLPRSVPSIIFPSNTPLLLFTHTRTHKHARTRACVCVCLCVRGYLADTLSQPPPHACWCQGIWERRIVCVVGDDASARRKLQNPPLQNPALIKPPPHYTQTSGGKCINVHVRFHVKKISSCTLSSSVN